MIKKFALTSVLVLLIAFLLAACTSGPDTLSGPSASDSGAAVPGEKMSDDDRYAPGPMGSSTVHW